VLLAEPPGRRARRCGSAGAGDGSGGHAGGERGRWPAGISARVASLVEGTVKEMFVLKLRVVAAVLLVIIGAGAGAAVWRRPSLVRRRYRQRRNRGRRANRPRGGARCRW